MLLASIDDNFEKKKRKKTEQNILVSRQLKLVFGKLVKKLVWSRGNYYF